MSNYTFQTHQITADGGHGPSLYTGGSLDIAETVAVIDCQNSNYANDYAILHTETGLTVSKINAAALEAANKIYGIDRWC